MDVLSQNIFARLWSFLKTTLITIHGVYITLFCATYSLIAQPNDHATDTDVSSKSNYERRYDLLPKTSRIHQLILVQTDNPLDLFPKLSFEVGGFILSSDVTKPDNFQPGYVFGVLLNPTLQTAWLNELVPNLGALAALNDDELLHRFLAIYRTKGRQNGVDFVILPDETKWADYKKIIQVIHSFDPVFYKKYQAFHFYPNPNTSQIEQLLERHNAIILKDHDLNQYKKWLKIIPKKESDYRAKVIGFHAQFEKEPVFTSLTDQLTIFDQIRLNSIISLENDERLLPYREDGLALWTNGEDGDLLTERLALYYPHLYLVEKEIISLKVAILIDARSHLAQAEMIGRSYYRTHNIIWLGTAQNLPGFTPDVLIIFPDEPEDSYLIIPEILRGAEKISGTIYQALPIHLQMLTNTHHGKSKLLSYGKPEWVGMRSEVLDSLDLIAKEMITSLASPGAQVLVIKDGTIVVNKNYGYLTYDSLIKTQPYTVYDVASVTKVAATLLAVMKLTEENKLHLDSTVAHYLPALAQSNKGNIPIKAILAHQSGMRAYIPFWKRTIDREGREFFYYRDEKSKERDERQYGFFPDPVMLDSLQSWLVHSDVIPLKDAKYKYSDLGFMILHHIVEKITGESIDQYVEEHFYEPLGLHRTAFNPLLKGIPIYEIAPSEYDQEFRKEQIWGYVNDRNAAIYGGVAGHAGLFSTSQEMAVIMQMIMQNGSYGDHQYLLPQTLATFNKRYSTKNHRGLGWDKPGATKSVSSLASPESFGHTGFTGTMVWADPVHNMVFVFLSNRTFPNGNNNKLQTLEIRKRMHDVIYRSMLPIE